LKGYTYISKLINCEGKVLAEKSGIAESGSNSSVKIGEIEYKIPESMKGNTFFVSVELKDKLNEKISDALYPIAVSRTDNTEDYNNIFSNINSMPKLTLDIKHVYSTLTVDKAGIDSCFLKVTNPYEIPAFFIRVRMIEESDMLRTTYSDNYISLLPGENKSIAVKVECNTQKSLPKMIHFEVSGLNCSPQKIEIKADIK
jgi:hypothetical protein